MESLTILTAIEGMVVAGALAKVGEASTDKVFFIAEKLLSKIRNKSPETANLIENTQKPVDYAQIYLKIQEITKDLEVQGLLQEMVEAVHNNQQVAELVAQELNRAIPQLATNENWKGINIKGGINTVTGNTFQF